MTKLVGILNLTPDSFSDGGKYNSPHSAIRRLEQLIEEGADIIDIGAESTRPGAAPLSAAEEWRRLENLFSMLEDKHFAVTLSLDTRHHENAKRALDKGFKWINDVCGFSDRAMIDTVAGYDCCCVIMHSLSVPADKTITLPPDCDVVETITLWFKKIIASGLLKTSRNIIFDPGIGFGKTAAQSWQIVERIAELKALGFPVLIGHSRKSFLKYHNDVRAENNVVNRAKITVDNIKADNIKAADIKAADIKAADINPDNINVDEMTLNVSRKLIAAGIDYLRVHDVAAHRALLSNCKTNIAKQTEQL